MVGSLEFHLRGRRHSLFFIWGFLFVSLLGYKEKKIRSTMKDSLPSRNLETQYLNISTAYVLYVMYKVFSKKIQVKCRHAYFIRKIWNLQETTWDNGQDTGLGLAHTAWIACYVWMSSAENYSHSFNAVVVTLGGII